MINASLVGRGIIQYANYTENYLKEHKQELEDTYPFDASKLPNYCTYAFNECPDCKNNRKIDAIVSSSGYSKL